MTPDSSAFFWTLVGLPVTAFLCDSVAGMVAPHNDPLPWIITVLAYGCGVVVASLVRMFPRRGYFARRD